MGYCLSMIVFGEPLHTPLSKCGAGVFRIVRSRLWPARSAYFSSAHCGGFPCGVLASIHITPSQARGRQNAFEAREIRTSIISVDSYEQSCALAFRAFDERAESVPQAPIFARRNRAGLIDRFDAGARFKRCKVENTAPDCSRGDLALKTEPFENCSYKQCLTMKVRSRLRVICATPIQKRAAPRASTRFLCCVCISHR